MDLIDAEFLPTQGQEVAINKIHNTRARDA
jgi:hypothetical protein